jgi:hypothetical protein
MTTIAESSKIAVARAGDVSMFFPLKNGDGIVIDDKDIPETLYIAGADCFKEDVIVKTTGKEVKDLMDGTSKDEAKVIFPSVWNTIKNANTDKLYARGGKAWANFCNDIIIYYVCRYKLFGTPMPMIDPSCIPQSK